MASRAEYGGGPGSPELSASLRGLQLGLRPEVPPLPDASRPEILRGDLPPGLRERLRAAPAGEVRSAAVVVAMRETEEGTQVLFTRRTDHLTVHAGQVSFPGGGSEAGDEGPVHTAFREAHEEVGLAADAARVLGFLDVYLTITGYAVTPVVCAVDADFRPVLDPFEVAAVFEVPLAYLLDPANHEYVTRELEGIEVGYWRIRWEDQVIWGATAGMLRDLYERVRGD